jgi:hypothetical protein
LRFGCEALPARITLGFIAAPHLILINHLLTAALNSPRFAKTAAQVWPGRRPHRPPYL